MVIAVVIFLSFVAAGALPKHKFAASLRHLSKIRKCASSIIMEMSVFVNLFSAFRAKCCKMMKRLENLHIVHWIFCRKFRKRLDKPSNVCYPIVSQC